MEMHLVDPRTDPRWETAAHDYRVVFWWQQKAPPRVRQEEMIWVALEYDVVDAEDVHEVIAWAENEAGSACTYALYVKLDRDDSNGMIHIAGVDPTAAPGHMTFRRRHPLRG
jgi:hypothetical protein